ncbi:pyridoxal phosphate-dependent aminotransferase [Flavilitoribacter nigricans]|uniref:Aminotransferase n=1 Tax=Flavilitoribacter nigricans (strain ATCC 23147 / DSM 23189 / NBRC 102662 / NCIMB 1420 / SS-2) TaxID=1122177 RepID=A0A2D0NJA0_FLAN2|nr:pyridoxal phosphate-dependent aminotransferase [Flavilitoribacter nigricans]PHN08574.1 aspartate aminotransferase [Flavilitoribacter nigricans DSM 23189 = NBRC 102662]
MSAVSTYPLSQRVMRMEESATLRMTQLARNLKAQGHDVISLSIGEPDFDTPDHIKEAAKKALDEGYTKYTPVPGLMELRQAICTKFKRDNGLEFKPDQIVVSNGAKQTIANLCLALLDEGDEVIILAPYWVSYSAIVELAGGVPVLVKAGIEQDYKVSAEQVAEAMTDKTKMVIFSSPCNPTGSVFLRSELEAIADVLSKQENIFIVSDEIYEYINFTDQHTSIGTIPSVADRTITVNGFAKGFAMTGWRLGYMGGPAWIAEACTKIQGQVTSGANSFGQRAAAEALLGDMTPSTDMRNAFLTRRDLVIDLLNEIPGFKVNKPEGAFYIFPDISEYFGKSDGEVTINNADEFAEYILNTAYVAVVSGSAFGADNCFRLSYAASEDQLREAIRRIGEAVQKLK